MKRVAMGVLVASLVAGAVVPGFAHTKRFDTAVSLSTAGLDGSVVTVTGRVTSGRNGCLARKIVILSGGDVVERGRSSGSGEFFASGPALGEVESTVTAKARKKVLRRGSAHDHVCEKATSEAMPVDDGVDLTALPVGDGRYSTSPRRGYIYSCQTSFNGGGASAQGPWFNGDGTWDWTQKATVDGSVSWPHELDVSLSGDSRTFGGNNLPDHSTGTFPIAASDDAYQYDRNPNAISEQNVLFTLDATPAELDAPECAGGSVGYLLTGGYLFNGFDARGHDAVAWEVQDDCDGHPQNTGVYHYHSISRCAEEGSGDAHSDLVGYAFDGFGIFGHRGVDGEIVTNDDLDVCHGHTHSVDWDGDATTMYHYHATYEFPYSVGCFRGDAIRPPGA